MCFDPDGLEVGEGERWEGVEPVVSSTVNMISDDKDNDVVGSSSRKNKLGRRSFSRYVKAVLFDTSLMKKMRNQKLGKELYRTNNSDKSKPKNIFNSESLNNISLMNNNTSCTEDNHSTTSSTFSSSLWTTSVTTSSSSSTMASRCSSLSESVENSMQVKVGNYGNGKGCNGFNVGICSFVISLFVLVIWGKVCAIFCTSTWLFFGYQWSTIKLVPSENITVDRHFPEIDTELYKKKVIMEGLLERNHNRNRSFALLKQY
ncbi:hypothetical protein CRYUN_Cryun11dG0029400 [Craigia yunnanensis]